MKISFSSYLALLGLALARPALAESPPPPEAVEKAERAPTQSPDLQAKKEAAAAEQRRLQAVKAGEQLAADRFADAVARWGRVAQAWLKVARLAQEAAKLEEEALALETQTRRARTLVEQTEARRARSLGELRRLNVEPVPQGEAQQPQAGTQQQ